MLKYVQLSKDNVLYPFDTIHNTHSKQVSAEEELLKFLIIKIYDT